MLRKIEDCPHHTPLGDGKAACGLIEIISGVPAKDIPVGLDACVHCCSQEHPPTENNPNKVQASFIHTYGVKNNNQKLIQDGVAMILKIQGVSSTEMETTTTPDSRD